MSALPNLILTLVLTAGASPLQSANDNGVYPSRCVLLLLEEGSLTLSAKDGQMVFDSKRRLVSEAHSANLNRLREAQDLAGIEREFALKQTEQDLLPTAALSSDGVLVEKSDLKNGHMRLTLRSGHDLEVSKSIDIDSAHWMNHFGEISPGGQYIVLFNEEHTHLKLISTISGKVLYERVTQDTIQE